MVLVFRRAEMHRRKPQRRRLQGIDPEARYEVTFHDAGTTKTMTGAELARLEITVPQAPGSAMVFYKKI